MHGKRVSYYIIGEGVFSEAPPGGPPDADLPASVPGIKFGRLFGRTERGPRREERDDYTQKLTRLGLCMNDPVNFCGGRAPNVKGESDTPAGYTYLGQFIAHEVTHDSTGDLLVPDLPFRNLSTPEIDLDSLYGAEDGPKSRPELYLPGTAKLRDGPTREAGDINQSFRNDLPRGTTTQGPDGPLFNPKQAVLGDQRNDENLALAQTHVAFIHFHNRVVEKLAADGVPAAELFARARELVIRHYQWIILHDFLPRLVRADVLDCVLSHGLRWFKGDGDGLFIPLEFSAAAFRIGHTMVRDRYEWNPKRRTGSGNLPAPLLFDLFRETGSFRGEHGLDDINSLKSDWVIDWRHFYDFTPLNRYRPLPDPPPQNPPVRSLNMSAKLDTVFDMHLDAVTGFPDEKIDKMQKAITVRNLLRGFYIGLPSGEEAAEWMGETPLTRKQIAEGPHEVLLDDPAFWGRTPLWYYVLKEAELVGFGPDGNPGNRLGPVGGRIVAETLVGLIKGSSHSILDGRGWRPTLGRRAEGVEPSEAKFEMIDLLDFARIVSPIARGAGELYLPQP